MVPTRGRGRRVEMGRYWPKDTKLQLHGTNKSEDECSNMMITVNNTELNTRNLQRVDCRSKESRRSYINFGHSRLQSTRDRECHYLTIKASILHKDILILYTYAHNKSVKIYEAKLIEPQRKYMNPLLCMGMLTPTYQKYRSSKQTITNNMAEPDTTINQWDRMDIHRLLHPMTVESTFFFRSHGTFINRPHSGP